MFSWGVSYTGMYHLHFMYVVLTSDWRGGKENASPWPFDRHVIFGFNYWMKIYMCTCFSMTTWFGVNTCVVYVKHFTHSHTIRNGLDCVYTDQDPPCFHILCASQTNMLSMCVTNTYVILCASRTKTQNVLVLWHCFIQNVESRIRLWGKKKVRVTHDFV